MFAVNGTKKGPSGGCTVQILDGPEPEPPPGKFEYVVPQALNLSCLGINLPGGEGVAMQSPFDSPERAVEMSAQEWLAHEDDSDLEGEGKLNWSPSSMGNRDTMLSNTAKSWAACTIFGNRRRQDSTDSFNKDSPEQLTTSFDQDDLRLSVTRAPNLKDHVNMAASDRRRSSAGGSIARWFAADDTDDDGSVRSRESSGRWSLSQNSPACGLSGRTDTYCNTTPMHITPRGPLGAANEAAARLKGKFFVARALERARVSNGGMPIREGGVDDSDLRLGGCSPSAGSHGGDRGQVTPLLLNRGGVSFSADDDGSACFDDLMSSRESCVYDPLKTQSVCGDTPIKKSQFEAGQELAGPYFGFATEEYLRLPQESRDFFARDDIQDMRKSLLLMEDLHVDEIPLDQLVLLLQSAERVTFTPGEVIICHRDLAEAFYIILGPENAHAVSKRHDAVEGRQLSRGNYFGELGLIRDPGCPYAETVLAETSVEAIRVQSSSFHLWGRFHMHLLLKQVSLLAKLPLSAQMAIHSRLQFADFAPNSYIVRQGEMGDKFFMIMKGSAEVKDTVASPDGSTAERFITNLHEGHSFGELALIYDEPRSASVVAIGNVSCTYLTKDDFRACLSDSKFAEMMEENAHKIAVYREERARRRNPIRFCSPAKRFSTGSLAAAPSPSLSIRKRKSFRKVTSVSYRRSIVEGDEVSSGGGSGKKGSTSMVINNKYEIIKEIGKGSYGSVYSCRELSTGNMYAMKVIDTGKKGMKRKQMRDSLRREVAAMKKLRHPNIVTLWEVIDDPKAHRVCMIQEFMENGPILPEALVVDPIPEAQAHSIFEQALRGLHYLHIHGIIHGDIKPANLLEGVGGEVKIGDFGASVVIKSEGGDDLESDSETSGSDDDATHRVVGTPLFMAPELHCVRGISASAGISPATDVWALGVTLYQMVTGRVPWAAGNTMELERAIRCTELSFRDASDLDPHLKHLIGCMLLKDAAQRITLLEIAEHDWMTHEGLRPVDLGGTDKEVELTSEDINHAWSSSMPSGGGLSAMPQSPARTDVGQALDGHLLPSRRTYIAPNGLQGRSSSAPDAAVDALDVSRMSIDDSVAPQAGKVSISSSRPHASALSRGAPPLVPDSASRGATDRTRPKISPPSPTSVAPSRPYHYGPSFPTSPPLSSRSTQSTVAKRSSFSALPARRRSISTDGMPYGIKRRIVHSTSFNNPKSRLRRCFGSEAGSDVDLNSLSERHQNLSEETVAMMAGNGSELSSIQVASAEEFLTIEEPWSDGAEYVLLSKDKDAESIRLSSSSRRGSSFSLSDSCKFLGEDDMRSLQQVKSMGSSTGSFTDPKLSTRSSPERQLEPFFPDDHPPPLSDGGTTRRSTMELDDITVFKRRESLVRKADFLVVPTAVTTDQTGTRARRGVILSAKNAFSLLRPTPTGYVGTRRSSLADGRLFESSARAPRSEKSLRTLQAAASLHTSDVMRTAARALFPTHESSSDAIGEPVSSSSAPMALSSSSGSGAPSLELPSSTFEAAFSGNSDAVKTPVRTGTEPRQCSSSGSTISAADDVSQGSYDRVAITPSTDGSMVLSHSKLRKVEDDSETEDESNFDSDESDSFISSLDEDVMSVTDHLDEALPDVMSGGMDREDMQPLTADEIDTFMQALCPTVAPPSSSGDGLAISIPYCMTGNDNILIQSRTWGAQANLLVGMRFGRSALQGYSSVMEDRIAAVNDLFYRAGCSSKSKSCGKEHARTYSDTSPADSAAFFGVYDGHGGERVAEMLSTILHERITSIPSWSSNLPASIEAAAHDADMQCLQIEHERRLELSAGGNNRGSLGLAQTRLLRDVGSAAVIGILFRGMHDTKTTLHAANVGDCRCVLSRNGHAVQLTQDHKATRESEAARIHDAGGYISRRRLNGVLDVTRSFGDISFKMYPPTGGDLWKGQQLIARPDVTSVAVEPDDEFAVFATDGLWDVATPQEVVNFVKRRLLVHRDVQRASRELCVKAIDLQTQDNCSCIVVCLNQTYAPPSLTSP